jgi:hypothetical protein
MYDIVFLSDNTLLAKQSWSSLKEKYPRAKFADTLEEAQRKVLTKMFWIVWPDINISEDFKFNYTADEWSQDVVHTFLNGEHYDGILLVPKKLSISSRELTYRFFINKKEVDVIASTPKAFDTFYVDNWDDYEHAMENSSTEMFWAVSHNLKYSKTYTENFYFSHHNSYDRKENHAFIHRVNDKDLYNGVFLCSKHKALNKKQIDYRFLVNAKQWEDVVSGPRQYDISYVTTYDDYLKTFNTCDTEMFWIVPPHVYTNDDFEFDLYFSHDAEFDRKINHVFKNNKYYDGIILCSKHSKISQREFEYKFITNKKEHDIQASIPKQYDIFVAKDYNDFCEAKQSSTTDFFYVVPDDVNVTFEFDYQISSHQKDIIHVFKNGKFHDGIFLIHKDKNLAQREFDYKFFTQKKEVDILASTPKHYDIVFISYNESNATENFENIKTRFPDRTIHRVHGIKGIHQAHIVAAEACDTNMFWVVDGDAYVLDDFTFDHQVPKWQRDQVFVWRSKNPINDLEYGYGGVKLFPVKETVNMDVTTTDMTTSISSKFNAMPKVSNIAAFNIGPFETWKSAFRECCKLSSKTIRGQVDNESEERLRIWTTMGRDVPFGEYAIKGAIAGREFGLSSSSNLQLINDFDWLQEQFDATCK